MVIELILNPLKAEKRPWQVFFLGAFYSFVAILLSLWVFYQYSSLVMVFLVVFASFPLFFAATKEEEAKEMQESQYHGELFKEHWRVLYFFMQLFLGVVFAMALSYIFLPTETVNTLFKVQTETLVHITGGATGIRETFMPVLAIFLNNTKVLIFSIIFSLIFGVGALFILIWNATVLGAAIGNFIRVQMDLYAATTGLVKASNYLQIFSIGFTKYAIHGIPEIFAYFVGSLAGGILSFAIINKDFQNDKFQRILIDVANLSLVAILILLVAALLEVFVTPAIF